MKEYIKKEDVERILFKIIRESASDIKKYIKNMSESELEEYKKSFMETNFKCVTFSSKEN